MAAILTRYIPASRLYFPGVRLDEKKNEKEKNGDERDVGTLACPPYKTFPYVFSSLAVFLAAPQIA